MLQLLVHLTFVYITIILMTLFTHEAGMFHTASVNLASHDALELFVSALQHKTLEPCIAHQILTCCASDLGLPRQGHSVSA